MLVADVVLGCLHGCQHVMLTQLLENWHFGLLTAPDLGLPLYCWEREGFGAIIQSAKIWLS